MFSQFASTAASVTQATSLMNRVGTDAYLYDDPEDGNIALLLDSKFEAEKVEGMKRLISLRSQGHDVSSFFPQVVKNVATTLLEGAMQKLNTGIAWQSQMSFLPSRPM